MANNQNLESHHSTHREVQHAGHDSTPHQASHEAAHHLTHSDVDHKNLSKLPTNQAAENATPKMELHDSSKEAPKKEPLTANRMVAQDMVSDLKNKDMQGQLSKMTADELGVLGANAAEKGGPEGLKQFGENMSKEFDKAQTEAGVKPDWQKKFEMGNNTGKWQDYSIAKGDVKETAGFSYNPDKYNSNNGH